MIRIAIVDDEEKVLSYISNKIFEILENFKYDAKIVKYTNGHEIIEADKVHKVETKQAGSISKMGAKSQTT